MSEDLFSTVEQWREIPGWESIYEVSTFGGIRSLGRLAHNGKWWKSRSLTPSPTGTGHRTVKLTREGVSKTYLIHRLVMLAFVGPCPAGLEVCHENDDPGDNRLCKLRYGTHQDNLLDAVRNGGVRIGVDHSFAKITPEIALEIRRRRALGVSQQAVATALGVSRGIVRDIDSGATWKHVS